MVRPSSFSFREWSNGLFKSICNPLLLRALACVIVQTLCEGSEEEAVVDLLDLGMELLSNQEPIQAPEQLEKLSSITDLAVALGGGGDFDSPARMGAVVFGAVGSWVSQGSDSGELSVLREELNRATLSRKIAFDEFKPILEARIRDLVRTRLLADLYGPTG